MGGSNEFVECFCGGAVAEGGSGAVVELVAMDGRGVNMSYRPATVQGAKCRKDWESTSRLDSVPMGGGKA